MVIFCNGMLRSGSTLQYNIARELLAVTKTGLEHGFYFEQDYSTLAGEIKGWRKDKRNHVLKTHDIYPDIEDLIKSNDANVLYIYRDIMDVAFSSKRIFKVEGQTLFESIEGALEKYYALKNLSGVLFQKYEDVTKDLTGAIKQIAIFLKLKVSDEDIQIVADRCSKENLAKQAMNNTAPNCIESKFLRKIYMVYRAIVKRMPQKVKLGIKAIACYRYVNPFSKYDSRFGYDPKTLLHANHISTDIERDGNTPGLTEDERKVILSMCKAWRIEVGYEKDC